MSPDVGGTGAERRARIEELFEDALDQPYDARREWLARRCRDDAALAAEVAALLSAHDRAEGILETDAAGAARALVAVSAQASALGDRRVGPYRLLRELGRGGMGVVYLAERDDGQYRRRVALKLLRDGPDAEELHRRFRAERQILASLSHPNIAQLLDGGVTDGQLPYLVMEYVDGLPITDYCDRHRFGVRGRLKLFRDVCAAVHHAHQNLVLHRDIKPGNILVAADGTVKLLDFGIAKLLNPTLGPADGPITHTALRPMTPEYASPEQVRGETLSTASDVYALGIVLHELLAGRRPFRLGGSSPQELVRAVLEREPDRPSSLVARAAGGAGADADEAAAAAAARGVSAERLARQLRGDLDAIVLMALRKEPRARYGSADLLWEDVQRYLDGLPVLAHRGTRVYRARKFLARHRVEAVAGVALALTLVAGTAVALRLASRATRERDRAERARAVAEQALRQSESVTDFLVALFDARNMAASGGGGLTADDLVRRGAVRAEALAGHPPLQARMLEAVGRVYVSMARYPEARAALERSVAVRVRHAGRDDLESAVTMTHLADVLRRLGRYDEADAMARRALTVRVERLGPRDPAVAEVLAQLSGIAIYRGRPDEGLELARRALELRRASPAAGDSALAASLELYASQLRRHVRIPEAEAALRESIDLYRLAKGPASAEAAVVQLRLADLLLEERGDTAESERIVREALAMLRATLGPDHPRVTTAMSDLADRLSLRGEHAEAERLLKAGLEATRRAYGPDHPNNAEYATGLAEVYTRWGHYADAERTRREALRIFERTFGPTHPVYAGALAGWGAALADVGRADEGIAAIEHAIELRRAAFGAESQLVALSYASIAEIHARRGEYAAADSLFARALAILRRLVPPQHIDARRVHRQMAERYEREGRRADAVRERALSEAR